LDQAVIRARYADERSARAVAEAVAVDNQPSPAGLTIETRLEGDTVVTMIQSLTRLETFIATVNDLLQNMQVVERTIGALKQEQSGPASRRSSRAG